MTLSNQNLGRNIKKARTTTTTQITEIMGLSGIITAPQPPQLFFVCFMLTIHQTLNNKAEVFKLCLTPEPLEKSAEMY